jgi:hypothetical protein
MIHCLLQEELSVLIFGDDLHSVILSYRLVESMSKCFAYDKAS